MQIRVYKSETNSYKIVNIIGKYMFIGNYNNNNLKKVKSIIEQNLKMNLELLMIAKKIIYMLIQILKKQKKQQLFIMTMEK